MILGNANFDSFLRSIFHDHSFFLLALIDLYFDCLALTFSNLSVGPI